VEKEFIDAIKEMYAMGAAPAEIAQATKMDLEKVQEILDGNGRRCGKSE
tara:strand:+ start:1079 stop:1225 length:147 start_codon:yes stop_codon:yes gene_type:complete